MLSEIKRQSGNTWCGDNTRTLYTLKVSGIKSTEYDNNIQNIILLNRKRVSHRGNNDIITT